ncbi:hypothetical protein PVK06_023423 [Gossypium arboreum]|uniref:RNase H type-1 domain-containing protein n=1 Tax=Gossypium arboreum TaxID=29729 RepID=A0ABR0PBE6_GOSAR|nr:hypothetical protein PVK06_023423 [Gossypium arboreum]
MEVFAAVQVPTERIIALADELWRAWEEAGRVYVAAGDASRFVMDEWVGFAAVIQDSYGHVLRSFTGRMEGLIEPLLAEAIAIRESLSWLKSLHLDRVVIESDCLMIVEALPVSYNINNWYILHDCLWLRSSFASLFFCWTCRSVDKAVHPLVRVALLHTCSFH